MALTLFKPFSRWSEKTEPAAERRCILSAASTVEDNRPDNRCFYTDCACLLLAAGGRVARCWPPSPPLADHPIGHFCCYADQHGHFRYLFNPSFVVEIIEQSLRFFVISFNLKIFFKLAVSLPVPNKDHQMHQMVTFGTCLNLEVCLKFLFFKFLSLNEFFFKSLSSTRTLFELTLHNVAFSFCWQRSQSLRFWSSTSTYGVRV
jgi:hypothetical protein